MAQMVRKQVYIEKRQELLLKRLARRRGVSEAEIIRQAIDQQAQSAASQPMPPDAQALAAVFQFALERRRAGEGGKAYHWRRDDAYEERDRRLARP